MEGASLNHKSFATSKGEETLHEFPKPIADNEKKLAKEADAFATAVHNLINEKIFKLFLRAINEKEISGSNDNLALLQNRMVQECINLSEANTDLVLRKFDRSFREWFLKTYGPTGTDSRVYKRIVSGTSVKNEDNNHIELNRGIKNVISFLKARTKLLESNQAQNFNFYFSSKLDARHCIDIIEQIESDGDTIISLFQIKSSLPSQEEIEKIHQNHAEWVKEGWINLPDYERSYVGDGAVEEVSQFLKNKEEIEEALMEFFTNPGGQDLEHLLDSLHLTNLNHRQQAWILWKYVDLIKEQLDLAFQDGVLDLEMKDFVWQELSTLKEKLEKKARLPKSQILIKNIHSIISIGARSISEREIEVGKEGKVININ